MGRWRNKGADLKCSYGFILEVSHVRNECFCWCVLRRFASHSSNRYSVIWGWGRKKKKRKEKLERNWPARKWLEGFAREMLWALPGAERDVADGAWRCHRGGSFWTPCSAYKLGLVTREWRETFLIYFGQGQHYIWGSSSCNNLQQLPAELKYNSKVTQERWWRIKISILIFFYHKATKEGNICRYIKLEQLLDATRGERPTLLQWRSANFWMAVI